MDHIFIDVSYEKKNVTAIAAVRTSKDGKVLTSFSEEVDGNGLGDSPVAVIDNLLSTMLAPNFIKEYILIAAHAEVDRQALKELWKSSNLRRRQSQGRIDEPFQGRSWIDILQLAWPMVYNNQISDRSFDTLCKHFEVENKDSDTAMGNCEALVRCYWKLMQQYKVALYGEGLVREIGGKGYEILVSFFK